MTQFGTLILSQSVTGGYKPGELPRVCSLSRYKGKLSSTGCCAVRCCGRDKTVVAFCSHGFSVFDWSVSTPDIRPYFEHFVCQLASKEYTASVAKLGIFIARVTSSSPFQRSAYRIQLQIPWAYRWHREQLLKVVPQTICGAMAAQSLERARSLLPLWSIATAYRRFQGRTREAKDAW